MSYRLIDANAIAKSYPEVNDMPCIYADLPCGLDGGHYDMRGTSELQAENAKLREEFNNMDVWHSKELTAAMAENAKLRELVRDYERCSVHADCGLCEYDGTTSTHCPLSPCFPDIDELRERGVEVDA